MVKARNENQTSILFNAFICENVLLWTCSPFKTSAAQSIKLKRTVKWKAVLYAGCKIPLTLMIQCFHTPSAFIYIWY